VTIDENQLANTNDTEKLPESGLQEIYCDLNARLTENEYSLERQGSIGDLAKLGLTLEVFTGASTNALGPGMATNDVVQGALDELTTTSEYSGCCGEINAMSKALNAGAKIRNATVATVRATGKSAGKLMKACSSCQQVADKLGVKIVSPP